MTRTGGGDFPYHDVITAEAYYDIEDEFGITYLTLLVYDQDDELIVSHNFGLAAGSGTRDVGTSSSAFGSVYDTYKLVFEVGGHDVLCTAEATVEAGS